MSRKLELERPLVVFDLETTGLDVRRDRVVEMSCLKIGVDGSQDLRTRRLNPTVPISPEATAVHGISNADVENEPTFQQVARSLFTYLDGCDLSGFNVEGFDLPLLIQEFDRAGIKYPANPVNVIDSWRIFLAKEPRDLTAAYRMYCNKDLANAHSAEADTVAAAEVLLAQLERYADLPTAIADLHAFCHPVRPNAIDPAGKLVWHRGEACLGFGKHRDRSLRWLVQEEPQYLTWIAESDFTDEVKGMIRGAFRGEFPTPPDGYDVENKEENTP
ncbi:MAG: hypothetical protein A2289_04160 [Deltaproteobacteria bacterium RIFOXYA12_FULL_58_15]|nr:MAG: hypothetical protein A2289_04160 [Deltaproteobacteria bacterium RIFOXYA12_FULL_58_15]OGR12039.1 MAG: hypothetical protein A2341_06875 [Deltaproteobacteria bacterium RIFOXYB12_FULL_58_9]